jgi:hypothetical protein
MSVNKDGSLAVGGWAVNDYRRNVTYDFRNPGGLLSLGTHVIDSAAGVIYAQVPPAVPAPPPPASATACLPDGRCVTVTNAPSTTPAAVTAGFVSIVDADNLAVRERCGCARTWADDRFECRGNGDIRSPIAASRYFRSDRRFVRRRGWQRRRRRRVSDQYLRPEGAIAGDHNRDPGGGRHSLPWRPGSGISISPSSG